MNVVSACKCLSHEGITEMEDPRCKIAAIETDDPRCKDLLYGAEIEMEDPRCRSLLYSAPNEMDDPRCRNSATPMEDPRCWDLRRMW